MNAASHPGMGPAFLDKHQLREPQKVKHSAFASLAAAHLTAMVGRNKPVDNKSTKH